MIRFLLSHNHDIADTVAPAIVGDDFAQVFQDKASESMSVSPQSHPHWRCELKADQTPQEMGEFLAQSLKAFRSKQLNQDPSYKILILGGLKTTPATSDSPSALQPGEWGVDIVETPNAEDFLTKINWDGIVSLKAPEDVIQVIL